MSEQICVVGAGPAGLTAAIHAAEAGASVCLLERNPEPGRKLLLTGGGRCNLTHAGSIGDLVKACRPCGNSLKKAFYAFSNAAVVDFFQGHGLLTTTESDGCVFPKTGRAAQVRDILFAEAKRLNIQWIPNARVSAIEKGQDRFCIRTAAESLPCRAVVIATGGVSWPQTGSTGDGMRLAEGLGHTVAPPVGILCPIVCAEAWPGLLQGVSLERVGFSFAKPAKPIGTGAAVFTADGLGGPAAFDVSRAAADSVRQGAAVAITMDFFPEAPAAALEARLLELFAAHPRAEAAGALSAYLPRRVCEMLGQMVFGGEKTPAARLRKEQRRSLLGALKALPLTVVGCGALEKATVTRGGVERGEIDFKTMQSRLCPGLFFAGEVMDADGPCGGYNLQIAFSTGALAGRSAAAQ